VAADVPLKLGIRAPIEAQAGGTAATKVLILPQE
jgi:hypothetical protein